jgi:hypothetical protein
MAVNYPRIIKTLSELIEDFEEFLEEKEMIDEYNEWKLNGGKKWNG